MRATELASGLDHPEGVCWDPGAGVLYAGGELGQLYRVSLDGTVEEVARLPKFALGLAVDGRGRVVVCCQDARRVALGRRRVSRSSAAASRSRTTRRSGPTGRSTPRDSGAWGANDGCIRADGEVLSRDAPHFTNGLAVSADGAWLWVAESFVPRVGRIDLASGRVRGGRAARRHRSRRPRARRRRRRARRAATGPTGSTTSTAAGELTVVAEDPQGTLLAAPTNVCFAGPELDRLVCANLGRWHLTAIDDTGLRGAPLHASLARPRQKEST